MTYSNICLGILFVLFSMALSGCNKASKIPIATFNWDSSPLNSTFQDTIAHYFERFPDDGQVAMAIIDGDDVQLIGLKREHGQFDPIDNKNNYFEIGSITKTFTAALLSKLDYEEKISQSDLLKDYIDVTLKSGDNDPNEIQLLHLANHTSGLPRLPGNIMKDVIIHKSNPYKSYNEKRMMSFLSEDLKLQYKSGSKYGYSNFGVGLLGHILGKKMGRSYEQLLVEEICLPLGMNYTIFEIKKEPELIKGINGIGKPVPNWEFEALAGCGALKSTLSDMVKFTRAQISDTTYLANTHIPTHVIEQDLSVGLGWHINSESLGEIIWHNGGTGGYTSCIAFDKKNKKAVITLTNISALAKQGIGADKCTFSILKQLMDQ